MKEYNSLPLGWSRATVGDFIDLIQYGSSSKTNDDQHGIPVLRMGNIQNGTLIFKDLKYLPRTHDEFPKLLLTDGDILFNRTNSPELVGKTAVYQGTPSPCSFASYLIRLRLSGYEPLLLSNFINSPLGKDWIRSVVNQQVGQANINGSKLKALELPVPPLNEQRRIVTKIEALQERSRSAKEALDAIPPLLEKFRQSVLAAAFRGDLTRNWRAAHPDVEPASVLLERIRAERKARFIEDQAEKARAKAEAKARAAGKAWTDKDSADVLAKERVTAEKKYKAPEPVDDSELPELPVGWCWGSLDEISSVKGGLTKGKKRRPDDLLEEVPYLRVANVQRGYLDLTEMKTIIATTAEIDDLGLIRGDVLFNEGGDRDKLGRGWVWNDEIKVCIHQNHVFRARLSSADILPEFISHYGNSQAAQLYFLRTGKQTTNLASINMTQLKALPLPLAPIEEQRVLKRLLEIHFDGVSNTQVILGSLREQYDQVNQSILSKAFRGELVPQDPNDEPAEVLLERFRSERVSADSNKPKRQSRDRAKKAVEKPSEAVIAESRELPDTEFKTAGEETIGDDAIAESVVPNIPFLEMEKIDQSEAVWTILFGQGPLPRDEAIKTVAAALQNQGLTDSKRVQKGNRLWASIDKAIKYGLSLDDFDRSKRGHIRAILLYADVYEPADWARAIKAVTGDESKDEEETIRAAAEWARRNMGLGFKRLRKDGVIYRELQAASNDERKNRR